MRCTEIEPVLFPVEMRPIAVQHEEGRWVPVTSHRAVVNADTGETLGVVGCGYRLVTNADAVRFGKECARQLFGTDRLDNLEVFNVDAPRRPTCCRIDFIHKGYEVNVWKDEVYLPFLRVTNSYNASRALRFDVGFCRKLCLNGCVFEKEAVQFRYVHSRSDIGAELDFRTGRNRLEALRRCFETDAERLHGYRVPNRTEVPLFFKALALPLPPAGEGFRQRRDRAVVLGLVWCAEDLIKRYFEQLGPNAYALFNAITDFASNPPGTDLLRRSEHTMQVRAGTWCSEFAENVAGNGSFDLDDYLGEYARMVSSPDGDQGRLLGL